MEMIIFEYERKCIAELRFTPEPGEILLLFYQHQEAEPSKNPSFLHL